jgi:hypothetical protein
MFRGGYISRFNNESIKLKLRKSTMAQGKGKGTKRGGKGKGTKRSRSKGKRTKRRR